PTELAEVHGHADDDRLAGGLGRAAREVGGEHGVEVDPGDAAVTRRFVSRFVGGGLVGRRLLDGLVHGLFGWFVAGGLVGRRLLGGGLVGGRLVVVTATCGQREQAGDAQQRPGLGSHGAPPSRRWPLSRDPDGSGPNEWYESDGRTVNAARSTADDDRVSSSGRVVSAAVVGRLGTPSRHPSPWTRPPRSWSAGRPRRRESPSVRSRCRSRADRAPRPRPRRRRGAAPVGCWRGCPTRAGRRARG